MRSLYLTVALAPLLLAAPSFAQTEEPPPRQTAWEASRARANDDVVVTGVAKARDRLDSATSTSSIDDVEISKIGAYSITDLFRTIPGIRAEAGGGDVNGNYTIRGLPMVGSGAKYLQFQEDGLPVMEFGDIMGVIPDYFLRYDLSVAQIESIRGGSASTFASNAPGGVINLISNTGEVEGGSFQASAGLDYDTYRGDFSYGGHLSDTLRYHIGGFYREGEGPRESGFKGNQGGQIKANVTKEFDGGFVRLEAKFLDDAVTSYGPAPLLVSGTNDDPDYTSVAGFSIKSDTLTARNTNVFPLINGDNVLSEANLNDGNRAVVRAVGFKTRFKLHGWTISEHMRYSDQSGTGNIHFGLAAFPAAAAPFALGGRPGTLSYASGPQAGQAINPATVNGNGLLSYSMLVRNELDSFNNFTNDLRASRAWTIGAGELTTTLGVYNAEQDLKMNRTLIPFLQDVTGGGRSAMVNIFNLNGTPRTQDGVVNFTGPAAAGGKSRTDVTYSVFAPYGSLNYRLGKLAVGGSLRFDSGDVSGTTASNRATDVQTIDVDNDGVLSEAERTFAFIPSTNATPVDYSYDYTSYSVSANYRFSQNFSGFTRYSKGARAAASAILYSPAISTVDGSLLDADAAYDPVKQAEIGAKFRTDGLFANVTGFWAEINETNQQILTGTDGIARPALVKRGYKAIGAEFEGGVRRGPFSLSAGATITSAEITEAEDSTLVGNTPRRQADVLYQLMPQYDTDLFTVGASIVGTTESYAQDTNQLKIPGYATVNAFLQVRPVDRVVLSLNANNLFDEMAITSVSAGSLPASGIVTAQALPGRTVTAAVRFYF
ncbi:TonB-dependent receptor domain-containing protein [Brevundimonas sp. SL130]|uniref:TonB-dependent receptor domain-containing protein n=1 Tax=Brevundimonas sp. SL130 TaxID=2995143 RepID=UPI00226CC793|nr:TonB-dependent receptor [Brevundimonas sp. SL130]WAC59184.1 TonB-dependent receptor [Brevundimonas sp. SL130]